MNHKLVWILLITMACLSTCRSDVYNPDICFHENVLPIFVSKCSMSGCHSSNSKKGGYDLTNYEGIMEGITAKHPAQSEIYKAIKGSNPSMPVNGELTTQELNYIKIWIKMGAENTTGCVSCDTAEYTFSGRIKPILDTWCIGCHNPTDPGAGYDFTTYAGTLVSIGDGNFIETMKHVAGYIPMPAGAAKLSDCDINAIQRWLDVNYPNN